VRAVLYCVFQVQQSWGLTHPVITQLPFSTCFNTGAGLSQFTAGVTNQTSSSADSASHGGTTPATAGSVAGADAGGVAAEQGPWYNLLATDTLPCARDPVSQQVGEGGCFSHYVLSKITLSGYHVVGQLSSRGSCPDNSTAWLVLWKVSG